MNTTLRTNIKKFLLVPALMLGIGLFANAALAPSAYAVDCSDGTSSGLGGGVNCAASGASDNGLVTKSLDGDIFTTIVNTFLFIVGAVAVVMLIFGGFKYVTSGGDANSVTAAKNTIMYAVIGIIVAMLSYAILNYVVTTLGGSTNSTPVNFGGGDGLNE